MDLQLYTPRDVSVIINRSQKTVYRYIKKFGIPVIAHRGRGGRKELFITEEDVIDFIMDHFNDFDPVARMARIIRKYSLHENNNK